MVITELLEINAEQYPNDVALVEVNPPSGEEHHITWRDYSLIEEATKTPFVRKSHGRSSTERRTALRICF